MKKIFTLLVGIIFWVGGFSQAPVIQWQRCLGGIGMDRAFSVQQTSDGGYIFAGYTQSNDGDVTGNHGLSDMWVVKLNGSGILQWQKCLGGNSGEGASSVQQTTDGGYIVAGITDSYNGDVTGNHGYGDYWVVKLDGSGILQWQKCLGGDTLEEAKSIAQTSDGGYIVAGFTYSNNGDVTGNHSGNDFWIVKLDGSGSIQWQKCLGGTAADYANSIKQTADGGYIVAGWTGSNDGDVTGNHDTTTYDCWVVKLNNSGFLQWQKCLGGTSYEEAHSVQQTADGGYIVAGSAYSNDGDVTGNHGYDDYWIVKLDSIGIIQWQKCLGGTLPDYAYSIQQTSDGGYIVAGHSPSNNGNVTGNHGLDDYWVVKLNGSGTLQWQKCLGGTQGDDAYSIQQTTDGGFIVGGITYNYFDNGDVTGSHDTSMFTGSDCWIVKLTLLTGIDEETNNLFLNISPNPATTEIRIEKANGRIESIEIYDVLGQLQTSNLKPQTNKVDVSSLSPGIYFVKMKSKEGERVAKFVKQ
jgi:hypothetical protein